MPTFGVSAGLSAEHRPPQAGDVQLERPPKVQRWRFRVQVCGQMVVFKFVLKVFFLMFLVFSKFLGGFHVCLIFQGFQGFHVF